MKTTTSDITGCTSTNRTASPSMRHSTSVVRCRRDMVWGGFLTLENTMLKPECGTCLEWRGERCGRVMHGLACRPVPRPHSITWLPEGESPQNFFTAPIGKAKDTQVAGDHYKKMGVEPWDVVDTWPVEQRIGAYRHGALKYLMRMGSKDQNAQEIAKGKHYMEKLLEVLREADDEQAALKQGENTGSIK